LPRFPRTRTTDRAGHRRRRLRQELGIRAAVAVLVLLFDALFDLVTGSPQNVVISTCALVALVANVPYFLAARSGLWPRGQAYTRMLIDVLLVTVGLYGAGGLAGAQYLGVYAVIPVYAAIVFSSTACVAATLVATASFLAVAGLQEAGMLPIVRTAVPSAWVVTGFNLLVLNTIGVLAAVLAGVYRRSRRRLAAVNAELERAHDESLRLNAQIQRAARLHAVSEVAAGVTHEIGNVLQTACTHIYLARQKARELRLPEDLGRHLEHVEHSCDSAAKIVKNVLETAQQPSSDTTRVSIPQVARRVAELKAYDLRRDGVDLRLEFPADFPPVLAAPFQIQQIVLNLITNAQDALRGRAGARVISIVGIRDPGRATFEVRDTGPGIPAHLRPRLFEAFYTTKAHGTGLGLAISAGIAEALGGRLSLESGPGAGAIFRVSLPVDPG
jgi:signal transduction histidine kinase